VIQSRDSSSLQATFRQPGERTTLSHDAGGGLPADFVPHDLRHPRVTIWIADERNVHQLQEAMGHSVIQTTMRYRHLAKRHVRALVDEPAGSAKETSGA
jgi:integrase